MVRKSSRDEAVQNAGQHENNRQDWLKPGRDCGQFFGRNFSMLKELKRALHETEKRIIIALRIY